METTMLFFDEITSLQALQNIALPLTIDNQRNGLETQAKALMLLT
jgi:predicted ABC-type transport system involved in lysophospholipase L1 biosynthesis ATPase subunit